MAIFGCQFSSWCIGVEHKRPLVGQFLGSGLTCFMAFKKLVMNIGYVWALTVFCWAVQITVDPKVGLYSRIQYSWLELIQPWLVRSSHKGIFGGTM